jgi:hypothetical protein
VGKASTAKKVARAQKAGRAARAPRQSGLIFPISLAVVIVLGVALVWYGRETREPNTAAPQAGLDHWHAAYGFYICDTFQPNLAEGADPYGIHTHSDGIIHIHPFSSASSGANAKFGRFLETQQVTANSGEIKLPGGEWKSGDDPGCNGKPAKIVLAKWARESSEEPTIIEDDFGDVRFLNDDELYTVAYVAEDFDLTSIPKPPSVSELARVRGQGDVPASATTTPAVTDTTVAGGTDTTVAPTTVAATSTSQG